MMLLGLAQQVIVAGSAVMSALNGSTNIDFRRVGFRLEMEDIGSRTYVR